MPTLLMLAAAALADDVDVALTCPSSMEPADLRAFAMLRRTEVSAELAKSWLGLVEAAYDATDCGCAAWSDCEAVDCALPGGATISILTRTDICKGCSYGYDTTEIRQSASLSAPDGEPGVTALATERLYTLLFNSDGQSTAWDDHSLR